ncbi:hypothetical protein AD929_13110 [Gluconobacter potus]|uniref:Uncharacterized protein n=1 Tax=Gluconobacter potus TaxID=2724927 RepID=A0A149QS73_9PROT|nr:hypothetical protein [Gluconobacter potus]KXV00140.1 hypothetical protein AD929_13110 [Gluconobacter potus]
MPFPDLSQKAMERFVALLPSDLRLIVMADRKTSRTPGSAYLSAARSCSPQDVPELCRAHPEDVRLMGRARRLRILAWLAGQPDNRTLFVDLQKERDSGTGGRAGNGQSVPQLFRDDITAFSGAVAPRVAGAFLSRNVLAEARRAAMEIAVERHVPEAPTAGPDSGPQDNGPDNSPSTGASPGALSAAGDKR